MTTTLLGKVTITPKGAYSPAAAYVALDAVVYNGSSYLVLAAITGVTPVDDGVNYRLMAAAGKAFLAGSGAPAAGTGNDGDSYLDDVAGLLYGPKAGGAWPGSPVDISAALKTALVAPGGAALVGYGTDTVQGGLIKSLKQSDVFADFVVSGLLSPTSANLSSTLAAGVAYVTGQRTVVAAAPYTYTASQDTYVDLTADGVLHYLPVANGAAAPAVTASSLRLQKVVTSATAVTDVLQLATPIQSKIEFNPTFGFSPPRLYKIRSALARQAKGGAFVKIAMIGDSVTAGGNSDATLANYRPNSFTTALGTLLSTAGTSAITSNAFGNAIGPQGGSKSPGYWDGRLSGTGTFATIGANLGVGGLLLGNLSAGAGVLSFAPGISTDTTDIYYFDQSASFTVDIDGGAALATVVGTGSLTLKKVTVAYAAGVHTINVTVSGGQINIGGFDAYTAASPQVHLFNLGSGSATSGVLSATTPVYAPLNWYGFIAPDLSIICIGINDWLNAGTNSVSHFITSMQTIITKCLISGDVILMTPPPSLTSSAPISVQKEYIDATRSLAISNNIPLIDENYNLVSKVQMTANGLGTDPVHPGGEGHVVIARDIQMALRAFL